MSHCQGRGPKTANLDQVFASLRDDGYFALAPVGDEPMTVFEFCEPVAAQEAPKPIDRNTGYLSRTPLRSSLAQKAVRNFEPVIRCNSCRLPRALTLRRNRALGIAVAFNFTGRHLQPHVSSAGDVGRENHSWRIEKWVGNVGCKMQRFTLTPDGLKAELRRRGYPTSKRWILECVRKGLLPQLSGPGKGQGRGRSYHWRRSSGH